MTSARRMAPPQLQRGSHEPQPLARAAACGKLGLMSTSNFRFRSLMRSHRASVALFGILCCLQAVAQSTATEAVPTSAPPPVTAAEPVQAAPSPAGTEVRKLEARQVPQLKIRWSCEPCELNAKVPPLIEKSYAEEAVRQGYTISEHETAEVVLTDFRQRPPGVRVAFGVFAGKDRLGGHVSFRGQKRGVSDYSANALSGMNALCEAVGKQSAAHVLAILQAQ